MRRFISPLALLIFLGCSRTVPWMSDSDAIERAHESVLEHLKSPATAAFSNDSVGLFDSTLCVRGTVDAQNEFGAVLRQRFLVVFEPKEPHEIYIAHVDKSHWGTYEDSLNEVASKNLATKRITDVNMSLFEDEFESGDLHDSAWLKSGEFFPDDITGRTKEDSTRAVVRLKSVLFNLNIDSTEVDSIHRARLVWKPHSAH